ncbi:MAG: CHRD domain-containing protein [Casimicrobiaceae bacterium]
MAFAVALVFAGVQSISALAADVKVTISGDQEVPPVKGSGTITVNNDKTLSGRVTTTGVDATAAHIHEGASGKNGGVIVPLTKAGDNAWTVPAGAKFTDAQYTAFQAGNLYVNVHSAANKDGEIRGQLKP